MIHTQLHVRYLFRLNHKTNSLVAFHISLVGTLEYTAHHLDLRKTNPRKEYKQLPHYSGRCWYHIHYTHWRLQGNPWWCRVDKTGNSIHHIHSVLRHISTGFCQDLSLRRQGMSVSPHRYKKNLHGTQHRHLPRYPRRSLGSKCSRK